MRRHLRSSARFPLRGPDWQHALLMGGATGLLLELIFVGLTYLASQEATFHLSPLAVAVNLPAIGYALRVYRETLLQGIEAPGKWENWSGLLRSGIATFAVGLPYMVVPLLTLLIGLGLLARGGTLLFFGMVLMVLGVLAGIFTLFFLPMAMARYLVHGRIEAAFHPGIVWGGITAVLPEYVATYVLSVGACILAGLAAAIPYFGPLVWPFLWFYLMLLQVRLFGEVCGRPA